jgi:hypothetical protein
MTITSADIKLLRSQVMADVPEGGGAATGIEIVDGLSNNVFPDLDELSTVYGASHLRKAFIGIRTSDTDGFYGANVIISNPPNDPGVSAVLFSTEDAFDVRASAQSRIESYLTRGTEYAGLLFGSVVAGMQAFSLLQRTNVPVPAVGTTLLLSAREGQASAVAQYVRITDVTAIEREFAVPGNEEKTFKRLQVNVETSDQLRADLPGCTAADSYRDSTVDFTTKTRVYDTVVADAARYYGCKPLDTPVVFNAQAPVYTIEVADIFEQLVPSAQVEQPIADARLNQQTAAAVPMGSDIIQTITLGFTTTQALYVGGGILPGSLRVQRAGITLTDDAGLLRNGAAEVGAVDYANGLLVLSTNVFGTSAGAHVITYTPAAAPTVVTRSVAIPVAAQSQRLSYVITLDPIPARGSVQVSYLSGGRWYVLSDTGTGALSGGASGVGAGTANPDTGTVSVTLGALPDVGSQIIYAWAPIAAQSTAAVSTLDMAGLVHADVTLQPVKPGTLTLTWEHPTGTARTASDNGAGALTGDATGRVWYGSGRIQFAPNLLPAPGTVISHSTQAVTPVAVDVASFADGGATWTTTLTGAPIKAGSLRLAVVTSRPVRQHPGEDADQVELMHLVGDASGTVYVTTITGNLPVGTINHTTGALSLNKSTAGFTEKQGTWERKIPFGGTVTDPTYITYTGSSNRAVSLTILASAASVTVAHGNAAAAWAWWTTLWGVSVLRAQYGGSDGAALTGTFALTPLRLAVAAWGSGGGMSLAGVRFKIGGDSYVSSGYDLVRNPSPATGEGETTGTVAGYYVTLAGWPAGAAPLVTDARVGTAPATFAGNLDLLVDACIFRSAASPVKPGALAVVGKWEDGSTFNATAGLDGVINSAGVVGTFDFKSGVGVLRFGTPVATPSNPLAPPVGVVDLTYLGVPGVSWCKLRSIQADTLRYNATAYSYIPLDADILGLDPVRLPSDGRVPIYRKGELIVLHHTATVGPATVTAGQTINTGRQRLAHVRFVGANGSTITTGYTANLDAGTVAVNDTTGWVQPVTLHHRVEDMRRIAEAQITGQLRLTAPLTHSFPAGSLVSSALLVGNMAARVSSLFDQETWTNTWSDDQIGNAASGTYDTINQPAVVTNLGAVTERFRITFTSSTSFLCNGEHLGQIGVGTINSNFAPINPASGQPYFTLAAVGWGAGWSVGNTVRINTVGALAPVWLARVVKPGAGTVTNDSFTLAVRGDIDTP